MGGVQSAELRKSFLFPKGRGGQEFLQVASVRPGETRYKW